MANVVPANDAQLFLDSLATSQLLTADSFAKVRKKYDAATDPKAVARELIKDGVLTKWQATQLLNKYTAMIVGNYKLLDQLGVGEMGRVFLAEHVQMQRKVALKVLARKHTSQPNVLRRLLAEARRVAAIEHPNISHIHDVNQDGDRYFIVLEYIDGDDLQRTIQRDGKLSPAKAWNYLRQTAEGLAHAHAKGVLHGGLKPSNLLVDKLGNVKILDFGLAQLASGMEGSNGDSVDQAAVVAKLYRAPESEKHCTQLADVYSLGAALYYLLTGKDPTDGPASAQKLAQLAPDVSQNLVDLCGQLMSADPAARPQNDKELIAAIDAARPTNKPVSPPPKASPASTKTTSIPTAKALPDSPAAPAAKEPPPKAKKPVMAKALPMPTAPVVDAAPIAAAPVAVPDAVASETPVESPESDTPFAGFAIQTKKTKGSAAKNTSGAMPAVGAAAPAPAMDVAQPTPAKGSKGAKGKAAKTNMPLIIAGGVGGGVLVLTAIIALIIYLSSGKGDKQIAKADPNKAKASAGENTGESNGESNPPAAAVPAESNPTVPAESNPVVPAVTNPKPVVPVQPMPEVKVEPAKPEPMPVQPEVKQPEPPMVAVAPPPPQPKPSVPIGDPFVGFAKSVTLPKVVSGVTEAPAEMLVPVVLGPCKVPDENTIISSLLKGGETAYSKGKMKFTLEPANGGTSTRDWEFKVSGGLTEKPIIVATMSAKNEQLTFQWAAEAVKHPASAYLCNCIVELKAGNGKTEFAMRQPVSVDPIVIGIDKRPPAPTFPIDLPPEVKQLQFEIVSIEGEVPKVKIDHKEIDADKGTTFIWFGNVETEMPLCIKVDTSITGGRTVKVVLLPHFKIEPLTRPAVYGKKDLGNFEQLFTSAMQQGAALITQSQTPGLDAKTKSDMNQKGTLLVEPAQKAKAQFDQMKLLASGLQTSGKMHFRIVATTDDSGKVELVNSQGAAAAPAQPQPGPAARPAPNPQANADGPLPKAAPRQPMREGLGPKAPAARAPIGTIEVGAEELAQELAGMDPAEFSKKYEGKSLRLTGVADTLYPDRILLTTGVTKNGDEIKMVMVFAKKGDTNGIAKGTKLVIDGDYEGGSPQGPMFGKCEIVSK